MNSLERTFRQKIKTFYTKHGRHELPWRLATTPYNIAVSEIMLQQTQVDRVILKYQSFLKIFPTVQVLAKAPLAAVLKEWSGLGYNRRAKFLHQMAQVVVHDLKGTFPTTIEGLQKLPGVGPYTAGAIYAFAYNKAVPMIETNIRTVYIHHFFPTKEHVSDKELLPIITTTIDIQNPRQWYWALMDYGSYLKSTGIKNNAKSTHYTKQSKFVGSRRQIRGAVMRELLKDSMTTEKIVKILDRKKEEVQSVLDDLIHEGFITKAKGVFKIK
jgi:A/G-specific adenine glycosylase